MNASPFRDALVGVVNGQHVLVRYLSNYDVQKPETVIHVLSPDCGNLPDLDRDALADKCAAADPEFDSEAAEWFRGRRLGVGTVLSNGSLRYRQFYEMDSAQLICLVTAMARALPLVQRHLHDSTP